MATTTNYGWTTPDDTALVKDGASAIRSLGTAVDTTTKNLNPSTTLGDIEYRSSTANTNTRLGIGSTGNVLTVAGGVPTWAAPASGGGLTLLQTLSASGASVSSSTIAGTYKNLYVVGRGLSTTANSNIWCRVNGDSGSNYLYRSTRNGSSLSLDASSGENRIYFGIIGTGTTYTTVCNFELNIPRYAETEYKTILVESSAQAAAFDWWSNRNSWSNTAAITSITIGVNDTFASGSIYIYGVN